MIEESADPRQRRTAAWVVVALALGFHLWGLYTTSPPEVEGLSIPGIDKVAHVVIFALPTWALLRGVPSPWLALVPMLVHVPVSEWVPATLLPGRSGDAWDALADVVGIAIGWWTWRSASRGEREPGEEGGRAGGKADESGTAARGEP